MSSSSRSFGRWLTSKASSKEESNVRKETSYVSSCEDEDMPLARRVARRERMTSLPAFKWTLSNVSGTWIGSGNSSVTSSQNEGSFWQEILEVARDDISVDGPNDAYRTRRPGTVCSLSECKALPRSPEEVRQRQEHVERSIVRMPALHTESNISFESADILYIARNGIVAELRDLYRILWSMEARGYDLCWHDTKGLFEWFSGLERGLANYLAATELGIYCGRNVENGVEGILSLPERSNEKRKLAMMGDGIARTRRAFEAGGGRALGMLRKRIDTFCVAVSEFTKEECDQLPRLMNRRLLNILLEKTLKEMVGLDESGFSLVMISNGLGLQVNLAKRAEWISQKCGITADVTMAWVRRYIEKHAGWITIYVKADEEYRALYGRLGMLVDKELEQIHRRGL